MKKILYTILYFVSPMPIILTLYISKPLKYSGYPLTALSMVLGAIAFAWLTIEFILAARPKFIEASFGMDKFYRFHGLMAVISVAVVFFHRTILEENYDGTLAATLGNTAWLVFLGITIITLLFMVDSIVLKIKPVYELKKVLSKLNIVKYQFLRLLHNLTFPALLLLLVHVLITSMAKRFPAVAFIYIAYFVIALLFYIYHKIIKPWRLYKNHLIVNEVMEEATNMWTLRLIPQTGRGLFAYKPGQFGFLRIYGQNITVEEHPFSLSSSPSEKNHVSVTIKALGDYTEMIKLVHAGDKAVLDAPYGKFSYLENKNEQQTVLIAGGVGITPMLSVLSYMKDKEKNRKVMLIWGINNTGELAFKEAFTQIKKEMKNLAIVPVVFKDDNWDGETGFIDLPKLERLLKEYKFDMANTGVYICGPEPMLKNVISALRGIGFNKKQLHYERFSL